MERQEGGRIEAPLAQRVGDDADAAEIAEAVVVIWSEISAALKPVIGQRGLAALYGRSLHLTASSHTWLSDAHDGTQTGMDLAILKSVMALQPAALAANAGNALLGNFYGLLASLVGTSLTERMLASVWATRPGDARTQDTLR